MKFRTTLGQLHDKYIMYAISNVIRCLAIVSLSFFGSVQGSDNKLTIDLEAPWKSTSFELNLIESIAAYNESLYIPAVLEIFGITSDDEIDPFSRTQSDIYQQVCKKIGLDIKSQSIIDFNFVNKYYSPRIQSHYSYYESIVEPGYESRLKNECTYDSFGNHILKHENDKLQNWILYDEKLYCSKDELYAIQTNSYSKGDVLPFDRIIGDNNDAPLLIFYGDHKSADFIDFFKNLYDNSIIGKLRFVWRYLPSKATQNDILTGYGVDVTLKNSDYVVIDENDITAKSKKQQKTKRSFDIKRDLWEISDLDEPVLEGNIQDLGVKVSAFLLENDYEIDELELWKLILQDFPKYASSISQGSFDNVEEVKQHILSNEKLGLSPESNGIYINGSPIHKLELDIFKLIDKMKEELHTIERLVSLGFSVKQAKFLIVKFALISAVKQAQFRNGNTVMGNNENRFKLYQFNFASKSSGIVFLNDIETDGTYEEYPEDRRDAYLGNVARGLKPNQIPPLKENVHDLVFALNFGSKEQLRTLFTLSKAILDSGIPQQVGLILIVGDDPNDYQLSKIFYYISKTSSPPEALAFLYKYFETRNEDEVAALLGSIQIQNFEFDESTYQNTLDRFSITVPSVAFNGVIYDLSSPNWQIAMGKQLSQDIKVLKHHLKNGGKGKLKDILYQNAKTERNLNIIPLDPSELIYKAIDEDIIKESIAFTKNSKGEISGTFWIIGNFNKKSLITQLTNILKLIEKSDQTLQVRVYNTGANVQILNTLQAKYNLSQLGSSDVFEIIKLLNKVEDVEPLVDSKAINFLEFKELPLHHDFVLFNSRYFRIDKPLAVKELELLVEYEFSQRIQIIKDVIYAYTEKFNLKKVNEFNDKTYNDLDWFDLVSGIVTKSFHVDDKSFISDVSRFDFGSLNYNNSIELSPYDSKKEVDILLIIDPIEEYSQKVISIISSIKDLPFVNLKVLLQPKTDSELKIQRFYRDSFISCIPQFDESGKWISKSSVTLTSLPGNEIFTTELDIPNRWIVVAKESPLGVDLDNIKFENYENKSIYGTYELKGLLVDGNARDVQIGKPLTGVSFELSSLDTTTKSDTIVMSAMGYFQFHCLPGIWNFKIANGKSSKHYGLLSASTKRFQSNNKNLESILLSVFDLGGLSLQVRTQKNRGYVGKSLFEDVEVVKSTNQADINIFSIASGHLYERFLSIMTASVRKHTNELIKFWIIENFVSSHFKRLLPLLAEEYNFQYEFVTYKWPKFLRTQREKQRTIWGYKILFLDVLFPQDLKKVIFVDADQVVRSDMSELLEIDLEGAAYGFTPMGESREDMEGFRFWKQGYWSKVLQDDLKYHISALFVIDLERFRQIMAGDRLRAHYQKLSVDPNSLANLDQDLPNNLQRLIKIHSLPQEWLWCETWCSSESLARAKTIDLCNNPLTKESKLERAKRQIPEWTSYDNQIQELRKKAEETFKQNLLERAQTVDEDSLYEKEDPIEENDNYSDDEFDHDEL